LYLAVYFQIHESERSMTESMQTVEGALFSTVSTVDRLGLYVDDAFHPKVLTDFLGLSNADVSHIAGVSKKSVRYDAAIPKDMMERLEQIGNICNMVAQHFAGDPKKTALWFKTKNPMLGDIAPRDMIRFGRYDKLRRFVIGALVDQSRDDSAKQRQSRAERTAAAK
jgi:hypothetical protein